MARQVTAEAVFNTTGAVVSLGTYNSAIQKVVASQNTLSAAIAQTVSRLQDQAAALAQIGRSTSSSTAQVSLAAAAYAALATQARAAAAAMQSARVNTSPATANGSSSAGQSAREARAIAREQRAVAAEQRAAARFAEWQNRQSGGGSPQGGSGGGGGLFSFSRGEIVSMGLLAVGITQLKDQMIELSDKWIELGGRIRIAAGATENFKAIQTELFDIAQRGRVDFTIVADQFSRIMISGKDMGLTAKHGIALVDVITDAGRAAHRTTSEIVSFTTQFPQAISKGVIAGDEFKSILTSYKPLVDVIAKNWQNLDGTIGTTVGKLMSLSRAQELYTYKAINAMLRGGDAVKALALEAPRTIEQALIQLKNQWTKTVGEMAESTGFTDKMTAAIDKFVTAVSGPGGMILAKAAMESVVTVVEALSKAIAEGTLVEGMIRIDEAVRGVARGFLEFGKVVANGGVTKILSGAAFKEFGYEMDRATYNAEDRIEEFRLKLEEEREKAQGWQTTTKSTPADLGPSGIESAKLETMRARMKELTAEAQSQLELARLQSTHTGAGLITAEANLAVEKKLTAEMRQRLPEESKALEKLVREYTAVKVAKHNADQDRSAIERLKQIEEEVRLKQAESTGNQDIIDKARMQLQIEKSITQELRNRNPELAGLIEKQEQLRAATEKTAREIDQWRSLYQDMGNTLVNTMIAAGKEGKSFGSALKDVGAQFAEMLVRAILLKPAVDAIANSLSGMTQGAAGGGPGSFITSLLNGVIGGSMGGASGGVVGAGGWGATVTQFAKGDVFGQPTKFGFNGGIGQLGESGTPEAVMPLARGARGELGIRMQGAAQAATNVFTIHVAGDMMDSTRARLMAEMKGLLDSQRPGIIADSKRAVRDAHQSNPNFLRR